MPPRTIAIDGPAGSGKSVVGLWLARELGYAYLDTGVLYRSIALLALRHGIALSEEDALARLARSAHIDVRPPNRPDDARGFSVYIEGADVTEELFSAPVNEAVSRVAAHPGVRSALLPLQRRIGQAGRVVMVGRDIGTVVLPDADLKLYLDASPEERARRRWQQEARRRRFEDVLIDVRRRDQLDSERATAPLRPADDAVVIATDDLPLDAEKARILTLL